jgi:hypothetical protein
MLIRLCSRIKAITTFEGTQQLGDRSSIDPQGATYCLYKESEFFHLSLHIFTLTVFFSSIGAQILLQR